MPLAHLTACAIACLLLPSCADPARGTLVIDVATDFVPGRQLREVEVAVLDGPSRPAAVVASVEPDAAGLDGFRVAELLDLPEGVYRVRVEGVGGGGELLARTEVRVRVETLTRVRAWLTSSCLGVECPLPEGDPALSSCVAGRCETPECAAGELEACREPPQCTSDAACADVALACGVFRCIDRRCVVDTADAECGTGLFCAPLQGCRTSSGDPAWPPVGLAVTQPGGEASEGTIWANPRPRADGFGICFHSRAVDLDPRATNGQAHVYLAAPGRAPELLSQGLAPLDDGAFDCFPSADGRFAVFDALASNLVPDDTNGAKDVFVWSAAGLERVSVSSSGVEGNGGSDSGPISDDGRWVFFQSDADDLVPDDTNGVGDVFAHDRTTGETLRLSVAEDGAEADGPSQRPSISADGTRFTFETEATNLVEGDGDALDDTILIDRDTGERWRLPGHARQAVISADGRWVGFHSEERITPDDEDDLWDVFLWSLETGETIRVSAPTSDGGGRSYNGVPSGDGRRVAFFSERPLDGVDDGIQDVFVYDRVEERVVRVSRAWDRGPADGESTMAFLSRDGRWVSFVSSARNLVPSGAPERGVYVVDLAPLFEEP